MQSKSIFESKSAWFNVIAGLAQILPGIAPMIPQPYGIAVTALGNILLRIITTQPVTVP